MVDSIVHSDTIGNLLEGDKLKNLAQRIQQKPNWIQFGEGFNTPKMILFTTGLNDNKKVLLQIACLWC